MKVLNTDKLKMLFGKDEKLLDLIVSYFLETSHHIRYELERSLSTEDLDQVIAFATALKEASSFVGGEIVALLCEQFIEKAQSEDSWNRLHHNIKSIDYECTKLVEELQFFIHHKKSA